MKKFLLITLMALVTLGSVTDAFGLFGARRRAYRRGYAAGEYGNGYYGGGYGTSSCSSCNTCNSCNTCEEVCPPPPCCEREQVITVREPARKVCGWVCPDGTREIPASEARHADY